MKGRTHIHLAFGIFFGSFSTGQVVAQVFVLIGEVGLISCQLNILTLETLNFLYLIINPAIEFTHKLSCFCKIRGCGILLANKRLEF